MLLGLLCRIDETVGDWSTLRSCGDWPCVWVLVGGCVLWLSGGGSWCLGQMWFAWLCAMLVGGLLECGYGWGSLWCVLVVAEGPVGHGALAGSYCGVV